MSATWQELRRSARFARWTGLLAALLALHAWTLGPMDFGDLFSERRLANLDRFLQVEIVPPDVRLGRTGWAAWAAERVGGRNGLAGPTLGAAVLAAALAAAAGAVLALWTSRTARRPHPSSAPVAGLRGLAGHAARLLCVLMRAPRVLVAFLLGAFLPDPAWAAVLALSIHNAGILGRLFGETLENLDQRPARLAAGAPRLTAALGAQGPAALPRWLTYFFVRFETCARVDRAGRPGLRLPRSLDRPGAGRWTVRRGAPARRPGSALVVAADLASWAIRR